MSSHVRFVGHPEVGLDQEREIGFQVSQLPVCPSAGSLGQIYQEYKDGLYAPAERRNHSARSARMGSVRAARQAGKKQAASDARVIAANAATKASGSRGLT